VQVAYFPILSRYTSLQNRHSKGVTSKFVQAKGLREIAPSKLKSPEESGLFYALYPV
jgi:hypothetical protein